MNRALTAFSILVGLGLLFWARESRRQQAPDIEKSPAIPSLPQADLKEKQPLPSESAVEKIVLNITLARKGRWPIHITLLGDQGETLGSLTATNRQAEISYVPGVTKFKVEAPHHRSVLKPWPKESSVSVTLMPQGDDEAWFTAPPQVPDTEGKVDCALRVSDSRSGALLAGVKIFIDETFVTSTSSDGEANISFDHLRSGRTLLLKLPGYHDKTIPLKQGQIDEIQVEVIFMDKK